MAQPPPTNPRPKRDMQVLSLGLPRTGSASIAEALTILGYKDVYHALKAIDAKDDWEVLNRATDATFPNLPTYTGKPFTRNDWDELYGHCEAATDMAAFYGKELVDIYPDAKVILVIRPFDKWYPSINTIFDQVWSFGATISITLAEPLLGSVMGVASRKSILGFFEASNVDEVRQNARMAYDRHHRILQEKLAPDRLLLYNLGDGWEPICTFLDKPIPDEEFPWVNEAAALKAQIVQKIKSQIRQGLMVMLPWAVGAVGVGVGLWMTAKSKGYVT